MTNLLRKVNKFGSVSYRNKKGQLHRDDGPAVIFPDGSEEWYKNGKWHRDNGPALIRPDGRKEWWENDQFIKKDS